MRQVIIVSLNNNAFHFDEDAYNALRRYLRRAQSGLHNNPDVKEILSDLERSIAEKCAAVLNPGKNVVNEEDIARILHEVGPVTADPMADEGDAGENAPPRPKRLFRQPRGAMISGVCSGLADYFAVDVIIVRIIFVGLLLFNLIGAAILYVVLRFVMPEGEPSSTTAAIPSRPHPALLIAAGVLIVLGVMRFVNVMPHWSWSRGIDTDPMAFGEGWFIGMSIFIVLYYVAIVAVVIAVGVALVKYLTTKSRVEQ